MGLGVAMNIDFSEQELLFQQEVQHFLKDQLQVDISEKMLIVTPLTKDNNTRRLKIMPAHACYGRKWQMEQGGTGGTRQK